VEVGTNRTRSQLAPSAALSIPPLEIIFSTLSVPTLRQGCIHVRLQRIMATFTPTSSIAWTQNHAFAMGMEANFTDPADLVASITQNIPFSIGELQIFGGSFTMQGNTKAAALFRVAIVGDQAGGDGGLGPGSVLILNHVLNVAGGQPCTIPIAPFTVPCANGVIPVPPDGSPYQDDCHH
jgi:hypothetical protein